MSMVDAILKAYGRLDAHVMDELPDTTPISLPFVTFRLGDLRALQRMKASGGGIAESCEHSLLSDDTGGPCPGELSHPLAGAREGKTDILREIAKDYHAIKPRESPFDAVEVETKLK